MGNLLECLLRQYGLVSLGDKRNTSECSVGQNCSGRPAKVAGPSSRATANF